MKKSATTEARSNLFLLTGENDFERKKFLRFWEKSALAKYGEFAVTRCHAGEMEASALRAELETPPFFGDEKRIFFLQEFPPESPRTPFSEKKKAGFEAIAQTLLSLSPETVVVCESGKPDRRMGSWKKLEKAFCKIHDFPLFEHNGNGLLHPKGRNEAIEFVRRLATEKGENISPKKAGMLVDFCGAHPWRLAKELEKLLLLSHALGEEVSEHHIHALCLPDETMGSFAFSNAFHTGKAEEIFGVLARLFETGESEQAIMLRDIAPTFRQLLSIKNAKNAEESGVHPFVFSKMKSASAQYSTKRLQDALQTLFQIEYDSKTGKITSPEGIRLALERVLFVLLATS